MRLKQKIFYRDIKDDFSEKFDTSNFHETSGLPELNKKVPETFVWFVDRTTRFDVYEKCLLLPKEQLLKMNVVRSRGHQLFTEEINKVSLSSAKNRL